MATASTVKADPLGIGWSLYTNRYVGPTRPKTYADLLRCQLVLPGRHLAGRGLRRVRITGAALACATKALLDQLNFDKLDVFRYMQTAFLCFTRPSAA